MAQVQQQITLTVSVAAINVMTPSNLFSVFVDIAPTGQFPAFRDSLVVDVATMQYLRRGVPVWPVSPAVLASPSQQALAAITADIDAATLAGVFNI
jgi:hypothetical protein